MGKYIRLIVILTLILSVVLSVAFGAKAAKVEKNLFVDDEYIYEIIDDSYVTIHFYLGEETEVCVPQNIHSLPVKSIESLAFCDTKVKSVEVSEGIENLESEAFIYARDLETVKLPSTVKFMGEGLFRGCENLKTVTFGNSSAYLGSFMFYGCTALKEVTLPENATEINMGLFAYCKSLKSFELSDKIELIGDYSFYNSGLVEIEIPQSVKSIGVRGFANCTNLETVHCGHLGEIEIGYKAFENIGADIPLGSVDGSTAVEPMETTPPDYPPPYDPDNSGTIDEFTDPPEPPVVTTTLPHTQIGSYYFGDSEGYILCENNKAALSKDTTENTKAELLSLAWNVRVAGDANCDGSVNIKDATAVQLYIASINTDLFSFKNADVNRDGDISIRDATVVRKFLAHLIEKFY